MQGSELCKPVLVLQENRANVCGRYGGPIPNKFDYLNLVGDYSLKASIKEPQNYTRISLTDIKTGSSPFLNQSCFIGHTFFIREKTRI